MVVVGVVAALGNYCKTHESYKMNKINVPLCGAGRGNGRWGGGLKPNTVHTFKFQSDLSITNRRI